VNGQDAYSGQLVPVNIHDAQAYDECNGTLSDCAHHTLRASGIGSTGVIHDAQSEVFASFYPTGGSQNMGNCSGDIAPTLKVGGSAGGNPPAIALGGTARTIVRRLTPMECERLMGWPDEWTAQGITDDGETVEIATTNRYRICGNGIVANVTEWIGNRLPNEA
jgi:site-specific DNA-cytosine methylase